MADTYLAERARAAVVDHLAATLRRHGEALPSPDDAQAFGAAFERFADARVVLLGEATHGTSEFYRARAAITQHLIRHHGFRVVALEADWPDAAHVDRYVRHQEMRPLATAAFTRFPTWMWRNAEFETFVRWLRTYNADRRVEARVRLCGLDMYSLDASINAVVQYLHHVDPAAAAAARLRYGCLTPWQGEPASYGRAVLQGLASCEDEVVAQLHDMLRERLSADEGGFDAVQNARVVRAAEQYYRAMYRGAAESWNLRDRHMFETLHAVMGATRAKAVVWAHNSHIGNAAATAMGWQGEFNIGELSRTAFGHDAVLIGFGTDRGTVAAADDWGEPVKIKTLRPSRPDSYEHTFHKAGRARSLTQWRAGDTAALRDGLAEPLLERAVGVVYRPDTERRSHYFEAVLADQFDAFVWFAETTAVTPLTAPKPHGPPDTWPFGL